MKTTERITATVMNVTPESRDSRGGRLTGRKGKVNSRMRLAGSTRTGIVVLPALMPRDELALAWWDVFDFDRSLVVGNRVQDG